MLILSYSTHPHFPGLSSPFSVSMASLHLFSQIRNVSTVVRLSVRSRPLATIKGLGAHSAAVTYKSQRLMYCVSAANNEEASARAAAATADIGAATIFDKIIAKEIPSTIVYEDEKALAFQDINPQAPVHILVIPKFRDGLTMLSKAEARHENILGHLLTVAKIVAEKEGILDGFRVVINNGPTACQSVYHLHLHVLGGRQMKWPPG